MNITAAPVRAGLTDARDRLRAWAARAGLDATSTDVFVLACWEAMLELAAPGDHREYGLIILDVACPAPGTVTARIVHDPAGPRPTIGAPLRQGLRVAATLVDSVDIDPATTGITVTVHHASASRPQPASTNDKPERRPEPASGAQALEPGTSEAVEWGCRCSVLLNGPNVPVEQRLTAPDCPLHAPLPP